MKELLKSSTKVLYLPRTNFWQQYGCCMVVCRHHGRTMSRVLVRTARVSYTLGRIGLSWLGALCQRTSVSSRGIYALSTSPILLLLHRQLLSNDSVSIFISSAQPLSSEHWEVPRRLLYACKPAWLACISFPLFFCYRRAMQFSRCGLRAGLIICLVQQVGVVSFHSNVSSKTVCATRAADNEIVTAALHRLHWLPCELRVQYKLCVIIIYIIYYRRTTRGQRGARVPPPIFGQMS